MSDPPRSINPETRRESVGIKEIARALGVSIGTVDRALHGRPGINPITQSKVLQMAQCMGYRPNLAARYLKSKKPLHFTASLPREIAYFYDAIRTGIQEAAAPFVPALQVNLPCYPRLSEGDAELFEKALREEASGIIISPGSPTKAKSLIRKAHRKNIPVVCVATDAPGTERLAAVTACPSTSGAIVGELLCRALRKPGNLAFVTGNLKTEDHAQKLHGFRDMVHSLGDGRKIVSTLETHDLPERAYEQTLALLRKRNDVCGIYVSTANSIPVLQAIEEMGLGEEISVVTTDLFPDLMPFLRSGRVLATMHQRPVTQGRLALQALYQFVVEGKHPRPLIKVAPHIVLMSNLELFAQQLSSEVVEQPEPAEVQHLKRA